MKAAEGLMIWIAGPTATPAPKNDKVPLPRSFALNEKDCINVVLQKDGRGGSRILLIWSSE
jgi:hypothetical protein